MSKKLKIIVAVVVGVVVLALGGAAIVMAAGDTTTPTTTSATQSNTLFAKAAATLGQSPRQSLMPSQIGWHRNQRSDQR